MDSGNESVRKQGQRVLSDADLRAALDAGRSQADIARQYDIQPAAVSRRVRRLKAESVVVSVSHPPNVAQSVQQQRTALDLFLQQVELQQEMLDAYQEQFRDENGVLHMCPSAAQHEVRYSQEIRDDEGKLRTVRRVESLDALLARCGEDIIVEKVTTRGADPRVEMRHLADAIAAKMVSGVELKALMSSTQAINDFREALEQAVAEVEPDVARRIARAVASKLMIILPQQQSAAPIC